jgi:hypothetical protein
MVNFQRVKVTVNIVTEHWVKSESYNNKTLREGVQLRFNLNSFGSDIGLKIGSE